MKFLIIGLLTLVLGQEQIYKADFSCGSSLVHWVAYLGETVNGEEFTFTIQSTDDSVRRTDYAAWANYYDYYWHNWGAYYCGNSKVQLSSGVYRDENTITVGDECNLYSSYDEYYLYVHCGSGSGTSHFVVSVNKTIEATVSPTVSPSVSPSVSPTVSPTVLQTLSPTITPNLRSNVSDDCNDDGCTSGTTALNISMWIYSISLLIIIIFI